MSSQIQPQSLSSCQAVPLSDSSHSSSHTRHRATLKKNSCRQEPTPKPLVSWPSSEIRGPRFDRLRFQLRQCGLSVPPLAGLDVVLSGAASEILQDVCLQRWRGEREVILGDVAGQLTVGFIGQLVLSGAGDGAGVQVAVGEVGVTGVHFLYQAVTLVDHVVHALEIEVLGLRGGIAVSQALEWSELRDHP